MSINKEEKYAVLIAKEVVNECINRGIKINTSKLNKLLYFMQRLHLEKYNKPMFTNTIIATHNGPSITDLWDFFPEGILGFEKKYEKEITLLMSHDDVAEEILELYGDYSPNELLEISKEDEVYKMIWDEGRGENEVIPNISFKDNAYTFFAVPSTQPYIITKEMQTEEFKKNEHENHLKFLELMKKIETEKNSSVKKKTLNNK